MCPLWTEWSPYLLRQAKVRQIVPFDMPKYLSVTTWFVSNIKCQVLVSNNEFNESPTVTGMPPMGAIQYCSRDFRPLQTNSLAFPFKQKLVYSCFNGPS
jgi:hypothetical protein